MNIKRFLDHLRTSAYSPRTVRSYACELAKFQRFLSEQRLRVNQVKPKHIERYLRWRDPNSNARPAAVRTRLAALKTFCDFVVVMANGHMRNPVEIIRPPRRQPPQPQPLSEEQVETIMAGISNARDRAIISLLLYSGLRLSELCSLNRDSVQVEHLSSEGGGKVVGVGRVVGKGNKEREFLIDLPTLKLIHFYLIERGDDGCAALFISNRRRRIDPRTIQHMLTRLCARLGLPSFHPHQLRATFASRLNKVGVPTLEISKLLGHASLSTTMAYVKPDAARLRAEYFAALEALHS